MAEDNQTYVKGYKDGAKDKQKDVKKIIETIDTQIPDDDGEPADISATQFKAELLSKLKERK